MEKKLLRLLFRSLDFTLKKKDRQRLNKALAESEELRKQRKEILALRQAIADGAVRAFRPQFAERVMSRIRSAPIALDLGEALLGSYQWFFGRLVVITLFILIVLFSVVVAQDGLFPKDAIFYVSATTIDRILQLPVF